MRHFLVIYSGPQDKAEIDLMVAIGTSGVWVRELFPHTWVVRANLGTYDLRKRFISQLDPERKDMDKLLIVEIDPFPPRMYWHGRIEENLREFLEPAKYFPPDSEA